MGVYIFTALVGVICMVMGALLMRGHIGLLHEYHRDRVTEENRLPLGRWTGVGMLFVGASIVDFSWMMVLEWLAAAMIVLFLGLAVGIGIMLHAIAKYNV